MVETKPLAPSKINRIASAARDGNADRREVCEVLEAFYRLAEARRPIPQNLIDFVAASFGRFLGHKYFQGPDERKALSLDAAFGLIRKRGRPKADEQRRIEMAKTVLRLRLENVPHQNALEAAAESCASNTATISEAWRDHLPMALIGIGIESGLDWRSWTADEVRILRRIVRERQSRSRDTPKARTKGKSRN